MRWRMALAVCCLSLALVGCAGAATPAPQPTGADAQAGTPMVLTSPAFVEGATIPRQYTCDGANVSPPLAWRAAPAAAQSLALVVDDPDAPSGVWVHWVLFNLSPSASGLPEGLPQDKVVAGGALQGINSGRATGYSGPCPPSGTHRYYFKLYALDTTLSLAANAAAKDVQAAMQGHVMAEAQLMGRYAR